jgi:hypothetical protein
MSLSFMAESADIPVTISISFCGWSESEEVFILTSKKKITSPDTDTELTIWSFPLCKTALCTNSATTEPGKSTLNMENQRVMTM